MDIETVERIHTHIYGDTYQPNNNGYSNWAYQLEKAIREKDFKYLMLVLGSGKGFNDRSKEIFCEIIGIQRSYLLKDMRSAISKHCGISLDSIDLHFNYHKARNRLERRREKLENSFSNGQELVSIVDQQIAKGFDRYVKQNRRTYLVNSNDRGWHLQRVPIKDYALAKVDYLVLAEKHANNYELNKVEGR